MNPSLYFAFRQRHRLNGDPVFTNPFASWSVEDLYSELLLEDDWEPAGLDELAGDPAGRAAAAAQFELDLFSAGALPSIPCCQ